MTMRKFILSPSFLSAIFSVIGVINTTRKGPRNWMLGLQWAGWVVNVALVIGSIVAANQETKNQA